MKFLQPRASNLFVSSQLNGWQEQRHQWQPGAEKENKGAESFEELVHSIKYSSSRTYWSIFKSRAQVFLFKKFLQQEDMEPKTWTWKLPTGLSLLQSDTEEKGDYCESYIKSGLKLPWIFPLATRRKILNLCAVCLMQQIAGFWPKKWESLYETGKVRWVSKIETKKPNQSLSK